MVYVTGPNKSYVVEPHGGELNYKMAEKNPLKFYDQVFNQDITKHEVKESPSRRKKDGGVSSSVTKREQSKIMEKIKTNIADILRKRNEFLNEDILKALED